VLLASQQTVEFPLGSRRSLDPLEGVDIAGDVGAEPGVEPENHQHCDRDDCASECLSHDWRTRSKQSDAHAASSGEGDQQEDDAGAERVCDRDEHRLDREAARGGEGRHCGDDRPRAGREEKAQANAEEEASAHVPGPSAAQSLERPLEGLREGWDEQGKADDEHDHDGEIAEKVVREAESREQSRRREGEGREARDEAGDDRIGTPRPARGATCEDDRQDG
jgi:hypothetical protein